MPFSSLKKTNKRNQRHYKERQQPSSRSHLGHLEKHKDYVVRARDYQRKSAALKSLRQRARDKNPDEFYFHMTRSRLLDGKHTEAAPPRTAQVPTASAGGGGSAAAAAARAENSRIRRILLEDSNYLRHKLQIERAQLAKLEAGMALAASGAGDAAAATRTVFDRAEFRRLAAAAEAADDDDALDSPQWAAYVASLDKVSLGQLAKERARTLKTAKARMARAEAISAALFALEAKRNLAAEVGRPRKLVAEATGDAPAVWKFAFKRKR